MWPYGSRRGIALMFRGKRKTELELSLISAGIDTSTEISQLLLKKMIEYGYSKQTVEVDYFGGDYEGAFIGANSGAETFAEVAYDCYKKKRIWEIIIYGKNGESETKKLYEESIRSESNLWDTLI